MVIGMDHAGWGVGMPRFGVVLTDLAPARLRKGSPSSPLGVQKTMISKAAFLAFSFFVLVLLTLPSQASNAGQAQKTSDPLVSPDILKIRPEMTLDTAC